MSKKEQYEQLLVQATAVLEGEKNTISIMSTLCGLLKQTFEDFYWVGFYVEDKGVLKIGPYQGTLGCLTIQPERGVCGKAYRMNTTQIVDYVHKNTEHISCDPKSNSEIVVPLTNINNKVFAVLDVDSEKVGAFDAFDQEYLELFLKRFFK